MNYNKHYRMLCERAKKRTLNCYVEKHHVIPRCMGGADSPDNIVELTAEEHYVAHQLLVKIYPEETGLIWAAIRMAGHSHTDGRSNNKLYGWLRKKNQIVASRRARARVGKINGSYGRSWYYNPDTLDNIKCLPEEVPDGYVKGRKIKPNTKCLTCEKDTGNIHRLYCDEHRFKVDYSDDELTLKLYTRYKAGESLRNLSKEVNFSHVALWSRFKRLGG